MSPSLRKKLSKLHVLKLYLSVGCQAFSARNEPQSIRKRRKTDPKSENQQQKTNQNLETTKQQHGNSYQIKKFGKYYKKESPIRDHCRTVKRTTKL